MGDDGTRRMPKDEEKKERKKSAKSKKKKKSQPDVYVVKSEKKKKSKERSWADQEIVKKAKKKSKEKTEKDSKKSSKKKKSKESSKDTKKKSKKPKKSSKKKDVDEEIVRPQMPKQDSVDYVEDDEDAVSETSEELKMKELLAQWDDSDNSSSSSSSSSEEEEGDESDRKRMTKDELGLKDNALDHILLAAPDFDEAMKEFEAMTAVRPSIGGSLKGLGALTARIGLDNQAYIEIIAPDPNKPGPIGKYLKEMENGSLTPLHYAIRQTDLSSLASDYVPNELGYEPDRIAMQLKGTDGLPRKWEMLFMQGHFLGGVVPYYVDWGECEHPISAIAQAGALKSFSVKCPAGSKVHELLKGMTEVKAVDSDTVGLEFSFSSPEGVITFSADNPKGLQFPSADDLNDNNESADEDSEGGSDDTSSSESEDHNYDDYTSGSESS